MVDFAYVALTIAAFWLLAVILRGVERLWASTMRSGWSCPWWSSGFWWSPCCSRNGS